MVLLHHLLEERAEGEEDYRSDARHDSEEDEEIVERGDLEAEEGLGLTTELGGERRGCLRGCWKRRWR